jgi:hypothetical protein
MGAEFYIAWSQKISNLNVTNIFFFNHKIERIFVFSKDFLFLKDSNIINIAFYAYMVLALVYKTNHLDKKKANINHVKLSQLIKNLSLCLKHVEPNSKRQKLSALRCQQKQARSLAGRALIESN